MLVSRVIANPSPQPADPCFLSSCDFSIAGDCQLSPPLDPLPAYSQHDTLKLLDPVVIKTIETSLNSLDRSLRELSLAIHGGYSIYPEHLRHERLHRSPRDPVRGKVTPSKPTYRQPHLLNLWEQGLLTTHSPRSCPSMVSRSQNIIWV